MSDAVERYRIYSIAAPADTLGRFVAHSRLAAHGRQ